MPAEQEKAPKKRVSKREAEARKKAEQEAAKNLLNLLKH